MQDTSGYRGVAFSRSTWGYTLFEVDVVGIHAVSGCESLPVSSGGRSKFPHLLRVYSCLGFPSLV